MNFDNLEKWGRCELQCSFTNQVIFIYNAKLGSRFIDASMRYKNKYHVILDLSKAPKEDEKVTATFCGT